jgi:serine/threonine-protein kinase
VADAETEPDAPARSYRELGPLAEGGMAVLVRAERDDGEQVVIKRIRPPLEQDAAFRGLFRDEGAVAEHLDSQHIVRLLDRGEDELGPYLVFEYVDGTDLGIVLESLFEQERGLDLQGFFAVGLPLLRGLAAAHEACGADGAPLGIVHRDVSPGNVLIADDGEVKLADFGVAASALKTEHTVAGEMKGKFAYMAPEQTRGDKLDGRADLFAAGIVLWECLAGRRLFDGPTDADVVHAVREGEVAPPSRHNPDVTEALDEVVARLLARDADARFASADEAHAALLDVARDLFCDRGLKQHAARLARTWPRPEVEEHPHVQELRRRTQRVMQVQPAMRVTERKRRPAAAIALAAVALFALAFAFVLPGGEDDDTAGRTPTPTLSVADKPDMPSRSDEPLPVPHPPQEEEKAEMLGDAPPGDDDIPAPPDPPPRAERGPLKKVADKIKQRIKKTEPKVTSPPPKKTGDKPKGFGRLSLTTEPWSDVSIDGNPLGQQTPVLGVQLPAGRHVVKLTNPHYKLERTVVIDIKPGEETRRFVDLTAR